MPLAGDSHQHAATLFDARARGARPAGARVRGWTCTSTARAPTRYDAMRAGGYDWGSVSHHDTNHPGRLANICIDPIEREVPLVAGAGPGGGLSRRDRSGRHGRVAAVERGARAVAGRDREDRGGRGRLPRASAGREFTNYAFTPKGVGPREGGHKIVILPGRDERAVRRRRPLRGRRVLPRRVPTVPLARDGERPAGRADPGAPGRRQGDGPAAAAPAPRARRLLRRVRRGRRGRARRRTTRSGRASYQRVLRSGYRVFPAFGSDSHDATSAAASARTRARARRSAGSPPNAPRARRGHAGAPLLLRVVAGARAALPDAARRRRARGCRWADSSTPPDGRVAISLLALNDPRNATGDPRLDAALRRDRAARRAGASVLAHAPCTRAGDGRDLCRLELAALHVDDGAIYPRIRMARPAPEGLPLHAHARSAAELRQARDRQPDLRELGPLPRDDTVPCLSLRPRKTCRAKTPAACRRCSTATRTATPTAATSAPTSPNPTQADREPRRLRRRLSRPCETAPSAAARGGARKAQRRRSETSERVLVMAATVGCLSLQPEAACGHPAAMRVVMVVYPDVQVLDVTGPLEVFANANRRLDSAATGAARATRSRSSRARAGPVRTTVGHRARRRRARSATCAVRSTRCSSRAATAAARRASRPRADRLRAPRARRTRAASPRCATGTFLLAEAGLLDGRRATTHWAACEQLAKRYPQVRVETDPIFVRDGKYWSSAGVCAGMDLALALVEQDHGRELALTVARWLVLFLKRPGGQSQFSAEPRRAGHRARDAFASCRPGRRRTSARDLGVAALAKRVAMSPRNFARVFAREVGETPARWVERARVEAARRLLEEIGATASSEIAARCGFGTAETLRRAFLRRSACRPAAYRAASARRRPEPTTTEAKENDHGHHDRNPDLRRRGGARLRRPVGGVHDGAAHAAGRPRGHDRADARADPRAKGMRVIPDHSFADAPKLDVVLVPGGHGTRREVERTPC